jgi:hypothetical protein
MANTETEMEMETALNLICSFIYIIWFIRIPARVHFKSRPLNPHES